VLSDLRERDARDSARASAPMVAAEDAVTLDTSDMDIAAAVQAAIRLVTEKTGHAPVQ
jgi:cytidylate kinase